VVSSLFPRRQPQITFSKGVLSMITTPVSSEEAANRQLCTAIRMFFADDDAVAVHTLACAAREIYEKRCGTAGIKRMMDHIKESNPLLPAPPRLTPKDIDAGLFAWQPLSPV
jgi:hypothetical protein